MSGKQGKIYICRYGQTGINLCPLMDEECEFRHDCDLRQVIDYDSYQAKEQECEELNKQLDKYLNQEEEDIRQLNNDNKLDDILSAIKKANDQIEKESKYKQALDEIENYRNKYPTNSIGFKQNILDIINKAKD